MRITDLQAMPRGKILEADVCIVGSGPAGFTIASELAHTRHSVLVLESGPAQGESAFASALNEIESIGATRVLDQTKVRSRTLGGTSHIWSGRCTTLDAIDYEARPWVPYSGWPLTPEELVPALDRSAEYLGISAGLYDYASIEGTRTDRPFDLQKGDDLRSIFWQFSRASSSRKSDYVRFGQRFTKLSAPNVRVLTGATVTDIVTNAEGNHVGELEAATPTGTRYRVRARSVILCGGGIENARMLLASNHVEPRGVGNRNDLVGRFLMDHPRAVIGTFDPAAIPAVQAGFGLFYDPSGTRLQRGLSLSPEVQCREQLLNCAAWTTQHVADDDVWRALRFTIRASGRERLARGKAVLLHADQIIGGLWNKFVRGSTITRRMKHLDLELMIEQTPDPNSRVTLSEHKDPLGVPLGRIDWKIGEKERLTAIRLGHAVCETLARNGLPTVRLIDWVRERRPQDAAFTDPAHPLGTTRMADSAAHGVVDRHSRVFGVDNLYIAGSSVFPTGGHANPTLMIVALALRVADELKR